MASHLWMDTALLRECVVCVTAFEANTSGKYCSVECRRSVSREYCRLWRERNPSYSAEYNARWRAENPDGLRERVRRYREENPDKIRESYLRWAERNPNYGRAWAARNREQARETTRRRRALLRGVDTRTVTPRDIHRLLQRQRYRCLYCAASLHGGYHMDHVIPVTRGGRNSIGNYVAACPRCNVSKSNYFLSEWRYLARRGVLVPRPIILNQKGTK